ncbi:MAG TPA: DUF917 domain-containing protein [Candidatus Dormibacteraeota bacterium]|nr:DUF917 domain-containing protein [Candidatus Dormibacteraeota bacterium]
MIQIKSHVDVDDLLRGADFMSASGGGDPRVERQQLYTDVDSGVEISCLPLDQFADDDVLVCCCYSGSIAPGSFDDPEQRAQELGGGQVFDLPFIQATQLLERQTGKVAAGLISIEIGGINTAAITSAAARMGKPLADADYSGRAIPELHASALSVFDANVWPFACVDRFGNQIVILESTSRNWTERISKYLALSSLGMIGCAFAALPVREIRPMAVPGTITESYRLGRAIRLAREAGEDPVAAAATALDGWLLFEGRVVKREWANTGYLDGTHELAGMGQFADQTLKVWCRNENHVSWLNDEPWVASPDLIEFCDPTTGEPLSNTNIELGQEIAVVGRRRRDQFDSPAGLAALGPRHFGFDLEFRGIESLVPG